MISAVSIRAGAKKITGGSISFVASSVTNYTAAGTTVAATIPAETAVADRLLAFVMHRSAMSPPAGWTLVRSVAFFGTADQNHSIFTRVAQSGDASTSVTFTQASSVRIGACIAAFRSSSGSSIVTDIEGFSVSTTLGAASNISPAQKSRLAGALISSTSFFLAPTAPATTTISFSAGWTGMGSAVLADNRIGSCYKISTISEIASGTISNNGSSGAGDGWGNISIAVVAA